MQLEKSNSTETTHPVRGIIDKLTRKIWIQTQRTTPTIRQHQKSWHYLAACRYS